MVTAVNTPRIVYRKWVAWGEESEQLINQWEDSNPCRPSEYLRHERVERVNLSTLKTDIEAENPKNKYVRVRIPPRVERKE